MILRVLFGLCLAASLTACSRDAAPTPGPEATDLIAETDAWTHGAMVAAADPRAVDAAVTVLEAGGHAVDAIIAAHAVLGLVEPQSSGIGGGGFLLVHERDSGETLVYDGRETAPADIDENLFVVDGEVLGFIPAWQSGRAVGVPGQVALYEAAHKAHGIAEWQDLFQPAIVLAESGFDVSPRLAGFLVNERLMSFIRLNEDPASAAYFFPGGTALAAGDIRDNPAYAEMLREVAETGPDAFYEGPRAERIVAVAQAAPLGGSLSTDDLAAYEVKIRAPLCGEFRDLSICSAPPPSSGGVTQSAILGLYDRLLERRGTDGEGARLIAWVDAMRLAFADRDHYVADPDFVPVAAEDLIHEDYLDARAGEVADPSAKPQPGDPGVVLGRGPMINLWGRDTTEDAPGTTHLSVIDSYGNAASLTASVEAPFGTSRMVDGFLLNNQLTDFARNPELGGLPVANAPAPGKRPRSSMSPVIVFDEDGDPYAAIGSPGGPAIISYVARPLMAHLFAGAKLSEAIAAPHVVIPRGKLLVEEGADDLVTELEAAGYEVTASSLTSGLHGFVLGPDGVDTFADPRREGSVITSADWE